MKKKIRTQNRFSPMESIMRLTCPHCGLRFSTRMQTMLKQSEPVLFCPFCQESMSLPDSQTRLDPRYRYSLLS